MNRSLFMFPLLVALGGCTPGRADLRRADEAVAVHVAPVRVERMALPVNATGTLGAKEEVALSFKIGGVVARVMVDEGRAVRAGEVLATLDLGEIDPGVARARSAAEKAERDLARARRLYADSVATLEQVQNAETARDVAVAELQGVSFNRRHAVITAPSAGVILRRHAEPGELVQAGATILPLGSDARGHVLRVGLPDRDVVRVRRGDHAIARFDAIPGRLFEGTVTEVAVAADPATGTYRVEVSLPGAGGLASGLVGTVEIRPAAEQSVALVPGLRRGLVGGDPGARGSASGFAGLHRDRGVSRRQPQRPRASGRHQGRGQARPARAREAHQQPDSRRRRHHVH